MPHIADAPFRSERRSERPPERPAADVEVSLGTAAELTWLGLYQPTPEQLDSVARRFGIDPRAIDDATRRHQRSKLDRYGSTLLVVLRTARVGEAGGPIAFGELSLLVGEGHLVSVRSADSPDLAAVRHRLEAAPELAQHGPEGVVCAILDQVVDEYAPIVSQLEDEVDALEDEVLSGGPDASHRMYALLSQLVGVHRAVHPLTDMLERLRQGSQKYDVDLEVRADLGKVLGHVRRIDERVSSLRGLLHNALTLDSTIVARRQSDEMKAMTETSLAQSDGVKKISAWAAIFFGPTLIATIYGMNFDFMPELHWRAGYPIALTLMVATGAALYAIFRVKKWL